MKIEEIKEFISETFEDRKLSDSEKHALEQIANDFKGEQDMLRFMRNYAFQIMSEISSPKIQFQLKWLERIIKTLDKTNTSKQVYHHAYFSPGHECREAIISNIKKAKKHIDICVFTITDDRISSVIMDAYDRGVKVRIISDNSKAVDKGSDIYKLAKKGIPLKTDTTPNHMHNKFALIDRSILINGSFNWTRSASDFNQENITVSNSPVLADEFLDEFEKLWKTMKTFKV